MCLVWLMGCWRHTELNGLSSWGKLRWAFVQFKCWCERACVMKFWKIAKLYAFTGPLQVNTSNACGTNILLVWIYYLRKKLFVNSCMIETMGVDFLSLIFCCHWQWYLLTLLASIGLLIWLKFERHERKNIGKRMCIFTAFTMLSGEWWLMSGALA